jgi:hypothetical protein
VETDEGEDGVEIERFAAATPASGPAG